MWNSANSAASVPPRSRAQSRLEIPQVLRVELAPFLGHQRADVEAAAL